MSKCPACGHIWANTPRSVPQNRAYFGLAVEAIAKQCNATKEDMHKALAGEFLGFEYVQLPNGRHIRVPKSTKNLSTIEFKEYVEKIQRWAAENGIDIPNPNEGLDANPDQP